MLILLFVGAAVSFSVPSARCRPQVGGPIGQPQATEERVLSASWWPTKSTPRREEYLGPAACSECHPTEAAVQKTTPMAQACTRAANSKILAAHQRLSYRANPYVYDLTRVGGASLFSVRNGERSVSTVLEWAFGAGVVSETYVFQRNRTFYESQLSYFRALQALDITPGRHAAPSADLGEALGRPIEADEVHLCFGCHNTASSAGGQFDPEHLIPGITCEACHGPGAKHAAAMKEGRIADGLMQVLNPAKLGPFDSVDFCGACHRTWADVVESRAEGIATVRFQPYRLELSRCWGKGDTRITCLACHDPHLPVTHDPGFYDSRCLRCHLATKGAGGAPGHPGAACPQSTKDCTTCHMPKLEVPGTHAKFTDHRIRIVRSQGDAQ